MNDTWTTAVATHPANLPLPPSGGPNDPPMPMPPPAPMPEPDIYPDPMPDPDPIPTQDPDLPRPGEVVPPVYSRA